MKSYSSFDTISLLNFEETADVGTGRAIASNTPMQGGGSIDDFGDEQTFAGAKQRDSSAVILKSTGVLLDTYINTLKKRRGTRGRLSRIDAAGESQFTYARLLQVGVTTTTEQARSLVNQVQNITLTFICDSDTWFGDINAAWKLNDGNLLNDNLVLNGGTVVDISTSPAVHTVTITQDSLGSKINVRGPKLTFTTTPGFSSMLIENDRGGSLLFTGTVGAGKELIIDAAASQVLNDGVDAYDDLAITYNLAEPFSWMAFLIGANELTFTHNGADDAIIEYTEEKI